MIRRKEIINRYSTVVQEKNGKSTKEKNEYEKDKLRIGGKGHWIA